MSDYYIQKLALRQSMSVVLFEAIIVSNSLEGNSKCLHLCFELSCARLSLGILEAGYFLATYRPTGQMICGFGWPKIKL